MALPDISVPLKWLGTLRDFARKVHALLEAQEKASRTIAALDDDVRALRLEVERLKVREEVLIARAEAAVSVAAAAAAAAQPFAEGGGLRRPEEGQAEDGQEDLTKAGLSTLDLDVPSVHELPLMGLDRHFQLELEACRAAQPRRLPTLTSRTGISHRAASGGGKLRKLVPIGVKLTMPGARRGHPHMTGTTQNRYGLRISA